jgi:hypothetical protein
VARRLVEIVAKEREAEGALEALMHGESATVEISCSTKIQAHSPGTWDFCFNIEPANFVIERVYGETFYLCDEEDKRVDYTFSKISRKTVSGKVTVDKPCTVKIKGQAQIRLLRNKVPYHIDEVTLDRLAQ